MIRFRKRMVWSDILTALGNIQRFVVIAAVATVLSGCLTSCHTSKRGSTRPGQPDAGQIHIGDATKTQRKIVEEARSWLGTPYKYAKADKGKGTDCSGMVMKVYEKVTKVKMPRNSAKQAEFCTPINASQVKAGDLVFFATGKDPRRISHVGIVIDNENFIHASASKGVVVSKITASYFRKAFRMFGRVPNVKAGPTN